jgi:2-polyprenyl-6-methoxyphenol hydroxylase-like FAD-dependent oxidoreductase
MRVLIAGGGPTGLALGIDLARRGVEVRVVDKVHRYFDGSRGDGIQPRTLEVLDDLGVVDAVLAEGAPTAPIRVNLDGQFVDVRRMVEPRDPTPDRPYPNPWVLGQSQLEGILRARLLELGVRVELGIELVGLEQDEHGVTVRLSTSAPSTATNADITDNSDKSDETADTAKTAKTANTANTAETVETDRFDYLVGADGGASFVRKAIGVAFPGTTDESFRVLAGDVAAPELDPESAYWFALAENPMSGVVMTPLPGTEYFQFATPLGEGDDASLESMQATLDRFKAGVRLTGQGWSTVWRPNVRLAERYRVGRVFLAGDAAHVHPPTGGQGMNTGVQDAYNLGWKLASGDETLLDTYETERRTVAARVLGVSTELLARYAQAHPDAYKRGEDTFGLNITYRAPDATETPTTGDRAPDAPLLDPNGKHIRLFDLFRGPHFTRLVFGAPAPDEQHAYAVLRPGDDPRPTGTDRYVIDAEGHAFTAYAAAPGDSILIRPDGYLA